MPALDTGPGTLHAPLSPQAHILSIITRRSAATARRAQDLVVFSHLRWRSMYQRPQHLMARMARRGWRVFFIEEPRHTEGTPRIEHHSPEPGVTVVVPHSHVAVAGFHDEQVAVLGPLLGHYLQERQALGGVAWLDTPMALHFMNAAQPCTVVYDCMDDLSTFQNASEELLLRETALMKRADLVFTSGPSLYEAKRDQHPQLLCLPSAVDGEHFAPSRLRPGSPHAQRARALQGRLPHPRLGYCGVIDERLDLDLLAYLAHARPQWQIVMVGPVLRIDPATLPKASNLHWLGQQAYSTLPYLMAGWHVCLVPFVINASTRFINPTKTLEYLASETPVVSTPLHDVVQLYGDVVSVASTQQAFVEACQALMDEPPAEHLCRASSALQTVRMRSWEIAVNVVHRWLNRVNTPQQTNRDKALREVPPELLAVRASSEPVQLQHAG